MATPIAALEASSARHPLDAGREAAVELPPLAGTASRIMEPGRSPKSTTGAQKLTMARIELAECVSTLPLGKSMSLPKVWMNVFISACSPCEWCNSHLSIPSGATDLTNGHGKFTRNRSP
jgi:hypothetical protein